MKKGIAFVLCIAVLSLMGCRARIEEALPDDPIQFHTSVFTNPDDDNDTYLALDYNGRRYIPFGNLEGSIDGSHVGECLGYYVQDGVEMQDVRIFLLKGDPNAVFLMRMDTTGFMSQPDFFRAVDTKDADVEVPYFIQPSEDSFWN